VAATSVRSLLSCALVRVVSSCLNPQLQFARLDSGPHEINYVVVV
jgi:hypothetical protein